MFLKSSPKKIKDTNTTSGDNPRFLPISLGSITFPIITFIIRNTEAVIIADGNPYCISPNSIAGTAAKMEPIFGIKFNRNAKKPQRSGKSIPIIANEIVTKLQ